MGLDMYLNRHIYIGANYSDINGVKGSIEITKRNGRTGEDEPLPIHFNKVKYIIEEAGYWRKANQIHQWFVDNIQGGEDNCKEYYVDTEKLEELLNLCKQIMHAYTEDTNKGITLAQELLPTQDGFFFGGTNYDEYYFEDIQNTITQLESALKDKRGDLYYKASW